MRLSTPLILMAILAIFAANFAQADDACYPTPNLETPQYIVGYGSLMEVESKNRTAPTAGDSLPVLVQGYERKWNATGSDVGYSTTYLGVVADSSKKLYAVLYREFDKDEIESTDEREVYYCRKKVDKSQIKMLDGSDVPSKGDIWIYVNKPEYDKPPSDQFPIVQSYVDIFISGCLELKKKFHLDDFVDNCISSTAGWSTHWVNDRLYPRRPFIYQPKASDIDAVLWNNPNTSEIYRKISLEHNRIFNKK